EEMSAWRPTSAPAWARSNGQQQRQPAHPGDTYAGWSVRESMSAAFPTSRYSEAIRLADAGTYKKAIMAEVLDSRMYKETDLRRLFKAADGGGLQQRAGGGLAPSGPSLQHARSGRTQREAAGGCRNVGMRIEDGYSRTERLKDTWDTTVHPVYLRRSTNTYQEMLRSYIKLAPMGDKETVTRVVEQLKLELDVR
ncbi:hypothetical protein TSOC_012052, partial [Tetrabaena socialis]